MHKVKLNKDKFVGSKDKYAEIVAKKYKDKGQIILIRHNPVLILNLLENKAKCKDVLKTKYPKTFARMFPK